MKAHVSNKQGGSILLEALIAVLIFSLGILGLVGLQAASIKSSADAQYRTEAALHADELIALMWVSDKTMLSTNFASTSGNCSSGGASFQTWCNRVITASTGLPGASATPPTVQVDATNTVTVTIQWQPPGTTGGPHKYVTVSQIN